MQLGFRQYFYGPSLADTKWEEVWESSCGFQLCLYQNKTGLKSLNIYFIPAASGFKTARSRILRGARHPKPAANNCLWYQHWVLTAYWYITPAEKTSSLLMDGEINLVNDRGKDKCVFVYVQVVSLLNANIMLTEISLSIGALSVCVCRPIRHLPAMFSVCIQFT